MKTIEKNQRTRSLFWANPFDRFLRNDFTDFWDGDTPLDTIPSINISEEKDHYKIEMAAPGLKKEDFNIDVDGNIMTISCEKESEIKEGKEKEKYSRREYNYSAFSRSFTIPENANAEKTVAKYNDGILMLSMPKKTEVLKQKGQKIKVE